MGGTSTDVSRYDGSLDHVLESNIASVMIQAPQLDINTVAAGGGSILSFRSGLFRVGPESAGARPGPACYKKGSPYFVFFMPIIDQCSSSTHLGGPLTVTDANLILGRLIPEYFPALFGPNRNESLDQQASLSKFNELATTVLFDYAKIETFNTINFISDQ